MEKEIPPTPTSNLLNRANEEKSQLQAEPKAGFWVRLIAYAIDFLLILIATLAPANLIFFGKPNLEKLLPQFGILCYWIVFIIPVLDFFFNKIILTIKFGGGIGKLACGLKIIDENGNLLKFWPAVFRYLVGYFVSGMLFGLGFFWILRDPQKQGWHDQVSGTYVVYKKRRQWLIGAILFLMLMATNIGLCLNTLQSIKENNVLKDDIQSLIGIVKGSLLENSKTPATIEPQEAPSII